MLSTILDDIGPCLSSKLAAEICNREGIKPPAARKRIERAKLATDIFAVPGIRFRHNEHFLYTKKHEWTGQLQKALFSALLDSQSAYRLPLLGLQSRGGIVPEHLFPTISGFPISSRENRQDCYAALAFLIKAGLLRKADLPKQIYLSPVFAPNTISEKRLQSRLIAETVLLLAFKDWLALQGLLSSGKYACRSETEHPQFGFFQWDLVAPSYISPISELTPEGIKPGFIVADVILGRKLTVADVTPFMHKVATIRSNFNNRPFLAILVADWFEKDALFLGRKHGVLFTTPKNYFGKPFAELLDDLVQAIEQKERYLEAEPDYFHKLISNVTAIAHLQNAMEAAYQAILSLLLAHCFKILRQANSSFDIPLTEDLVADLFMETDAGHIICQTLWRTKEANVDFSAVEPCIRKLPNLFAALQHRELAPAQVLICTNRRFDPAVTQLLAKTALNFPISYIDGPTLRAMLASIDKDLEASIPSALLTCDPSVEPDEYTYADPT